MERKLRVYAGQNPPPVITAVMKYGKRTTHLSGPADMVLEMRRELRGQVVAVWVGEWLCPSRSTRRKKGRGGVQPSP